MDEERNLEGYLVKATGVGWLCLKNCTRRWVSSTSEESHPHYAKLRTSPPRIKCRGQWCMILLSSFSNPVSTCGGHVRASMRWAPRLACGGAP